MTHFVYRHLSGNYYITNLKSPFSFVGYPDINPENHSETGTWNLKGSRRVKQGKIYQPPPTSTNIGKEVHLPIFPDLDPKGKEVLLPMSTNLQPLKEWDYSFDYFIKENVCPVQFLSYETT